MHPILDLMRRRIVVLDGAMGTMIQTYGLDEAGFRGERFADWGHELRGASDVLCLTQPDIIREIHRSFLDAGADVVETNTFNAQAISLADYGLEDLVYEINVAGARLARSRSKLLTDAPPRVGSCLAVRHTRFAIQW